MSNTPKPPSLAAFDTFDLNKMSPEAKNAAAVQFIKAGHDRAEVVRLFGEPTGPSEAEKERAARAAYIKETVGDRDKYFRKNWEGKTAEAKAALEVTLAKAGL